MFTRRGLLTSGAAALLTGEAGYAKRYLAGSKFPSNLILLNSNEHPDGPASVSIEAMKQCLHLSGRYRDEDMEALAAEIATREGLQPDQVVVGAGSSAILNAAVLAFASPKVPVIAPAPVFELPIDLAKSYGFPHVQIPLRADFSADVEGLVREARKVDGGLVYVCNPNNPTASITSARDLDWLVANLPPKAVLMLDEAYIHFDATLESGVKHVRNGKNVIAVRTFSKIYGMASLRVGFGCAPKALAEKLAAYRDPVISLPGVYAASAALGDATLVPKRRARYDALRRDFTDFLGKKGLRHIPSHANFVMFDVKRPAADVIGALKQQGILAGRPFPPYNEMVRISVGTEAEMAKCKSALDRVL